MSSATATNPTDTKSADNSSADAYIVLANDPDFLGFVRTWETAKGVRCGTFFRLGEVANEHLAEMATGGGLIALFRATQDRGKNVFD